MKMLSLLLLSVTIHAHAMDTQTPHKKHIKIIKEKIYVTDPRFFKIIEKNNGKINLQKYIKEKKGQSYILIKTFAWGNYSKKIVAPLMPITPGTTDSRCSSPIGLDMFFFTAAIPTPPALPKSASSSMH